MRKQPQYVSVPDSSLLVGIPTHIVTFVTDSGEKGEVHLTAGFIYETDDEDGEDRFNNVKLYDNPIEGNIIDAHYVICSILGIDIRKHIYSKSCNFCRHFNSIPGYQITDIRTVYTYETQGDGSSA